MMSDGRDANTDSFAALFEQAQTATRQRKLSPGETLEVSVVKVTKDAVFVDVDGKREGFIDSVDLIGPDGVAVALAVGDKITARVVHLGGKEGAVRFAPLARRSAGDDRDEGLTEKLGNHKEIVAGTKAKGTVTRVENYGAFVQLAGTEGRDGRGLLPLSETSLPRNADARKHFTVGQELEVKVVAIAEDGKIRLSQKALVADEEKAARDAHAKESKGSGQRFGTLGDLLQKSGTKSKPAKK